MPRPRPQPYAVYRVGGSVRDELLGRPDSDRDWVVVGGTPEILLASGYLPVGKDFPVFLHPETREEYALARTERKHGRGYRGFEFFASPEVTLEDDLARRDLTINAMARDENGRLIDPYGGEADLRAGRLRHVSPAFAEDPLRVLRVARFAARFGFVVAPATQRLMRSIVASGELDTLAPERVWQELARGLMEPHPSRMLAVLRGCGALAQLLPEVDTLFEPVSSRGAGPVSRAKFLAGSLDAMAARGTSLPSRYAVMTHDFMECTAAGPLPIAARVRRADAIAVRVKPPVECTDAAQLLARFHRVVTESEHLAPAALLNLIQAADGLRRPERLDTLLVACAAIAGVEQKRRVASAYLPADRLEAARRVVAGVDAGAIARTAGAGREGLAKNQAIAHAVRAARLAALRTARRGERQKR